MSYNSIALYAGDGSTSAFAVPFPYISAAHVFAEVAGVPVAFTWINPSLIQLSAAPAASVAVRVYRNSSLANRLVNFTDTSGLGGAVLDLDSKQAFYLAQEANDAATYVTAGDIAVAEAYADARDAAAATHYLRDPSGSLSALPAAAQRVGKVLAFDSLGQPVSLTAGDGTLTGVTPAGGSVSRAVGIVLSDLMHNVVDFGAVGDSIVDCTSAIQAAIDYAGAHGGDVFFPPGRYAITGTLYVGNGSASAASIYSGVRLIGSGVPPIPPQVFGGYPVETAKGSQILWRGAAGGTMLSIRGPIQSWGVHNLLLDGASSSGDWVGTAGTGILVRSGQFGDSRNVVIRGCRNAGIDLGVVSAVPSGVQCADSLRNTWHNIIIGVGWTPGAKGIVLSGTNVSGNTDYNDFSNVMIALPTVLAGNQASYGIYLQACDSNTFSNVQFLNGGGAATAIVFDYTVNASWPASNQFYGVDFGGLAAPVLNAGTPDGSARPNYLLNVIETNGAVPPANLANLVGPGGVMRRVNLVGQTVGTGAQVLWSPWVDGLYRVTFYLVVTGGNTGGGNLTLNIAWLDGSGAPSFTSSAVANGPGNFASGQVVVKANGQTNITYQVNTNSFPNGSYTQYALYMAVDRLA